MLHMMATRNSQASELSVVQFTGNASVLKDIFDVTGKYKTRSVPPVKKCAMSEMIAAAEQTLRPFIPDGEYKFSQEKLCAVFPPLRIGGENQMVITGFNERRTQGSKQVGTIMKLTVGGNS
jgi:hypothetical protein